MIWESMVSSDGNYSRTKVYKGWVVRNDDTMTMVYVPDPMHSWKL